MTKKNNKESDRKKRPQPEPELIYDPIEFDPNMTEEMMERVLKYLLFCLKGNNKF